MVREAQLNALRPSLFTLWMLPGSCNNFFTCWIMAKVLYFLKQSAHSKVHAEPCRMMQKATMDLAGYHRLPQGLSPLLFP